MLLSNAAKSRITSSRKRLRSSVTFCCAAPLDTPSPLASSSSTGGVGKRLEKDWIGDVGASNRLVRRLNGFSSTVSRRVAWSLSRQPISTRDNESSLSCTFFGLVKQSKRRHGRKW